MLAELLVLTSVQLWLSSSSPTWPAYVSARLSEVHYTYVTCAVTLQSPWATLKVTVNVCMSFRFGPGARFTKYLTTVLRLSYDNAKVITDLRRMSSLPNI